MSTDFRAIAATNQRRSVGLLAASVLLLWGIGNLIAWAFGAWSGSTDWWITPVVIAALAVGYLLIAWSMSARATLRLSGAEPASPEMYPVLHNVVEEMCIAAGMNKPTVWVIEDPAPNAFATGMTPDRSAVAVTTGLLEMLSRRELAGVIAHELGHIRNRDISITTISVLSAAAIAVLADVAFRAGQVVLFTSGRSRNREGQSGAGLGLALMALGAVIFIIGVPLSLLLKAALSRSRESLADATAVELTRNPASIRSALEKLEADTTQIRKVTTATAHMWIEAPSDKEMGLTRAFGGMLATHPPLSERIAILRRMEGLDPDERGPNDTVAVRRPLPPPNPASRWRRHP